MKVSILAPREHVCSVDCLCTHTLYRLLPLQVAPFRASKYKVTNGEFAAFVRDGGYSNKKWWSEAGWSWRTYRNVKWPTFWVLGECALASVESCLAVAADRNTAIQMQHVLH